MTAGPADASTPRKSGIVTDLLEPHHAPPESWVAAVEQGFRQRIPGAFFVLSRVLRRVIRHDLEITSPWVRIPHRKTYVISRDRLVWLVAMDELDAPEGTDLPPWVVLVARPEDDQLTKLSATDLRRIYWRLLFHALIDATMLERLAPDRVSLAQVRQRIDRVGQEQFDEIRTVLRQEAMLLDPDNVRRTYAEFVAVFEELRHFAPELLPLYFPSIRAVDDVAAVIREDFDVAAILRATRPPELADADPALPPRREPATTSDGEPPMAPVQRVPSPWHYRRWQRSATQSAQRGNHARAALDRQRAWDVAPADVLPEAEAARLADVSALAERLGTALELDTADVARWRDVLLSLLPAATQGFWNPNLRLLFDLQKVCVDHERELYRVDLWRFAITGGRTPLKRPLPNLRAVLITKHLRTASRRVGALRIAPEARATLTELLHRTAERAEELVRSRMEPQVVHALDAAGIQPQSVVERVAFHKLCAELLDSVVQRGFLTLGHVRDAVSRGQIKLPDLSSPQEFLRGDPLLRTDQQLSQALQGVYQRGPFYLRWLQRLTSLLFGTPPGRALTTYLLLPFGGAAIILLGLHFLADEVHKLFGTPHVTVYTHAGMAALGLLLFVLIHGPVFREAAWTTCVWLWKALWLLFVDLPRALYRLPLMAWIWRSLPMLVIRRYIFSPLVVALAAWQMLPRLGAPISLNRWEALGVFVVAFAVLNSRIGRDTEELVFEACGRMWHRLRVTVIIGLFNLIVDVFRQVMDAVERILYSVDEWLRFRSGESGVSLWFKAIFGLLWNVVHAVIRFCVTLLIEPQVNPIKHFPVVTVSHKLILPIGLPLLTGVLESFFAKYTAVSLATAILSAIPGVFGFLAWEFKENWRLYVANRPPALRPVIIGHHGETMLRLLLPGFHSGTIPKLFSRRRRAARKTRHLPELSRQSLYEDRLHHEAESVKHFVEREFLGLLRQSRRFQSLPLRLRNVELSTNRISMSIDHEAFPDEPLQIVFVEQSGWLAASMVAPGWTKRLTGDEQSVLAAALAGLYHLAGVELVREQIEPQLGSTPHPYDIGETGLIVWPTRSFETEIHYALSERPLLTPRPRSAARAAHLEPVPAGRMIFSEHPITWEVWQWYWTNEASTACPPALLPEVTLLRR